MDTAKLNEIFIRVRVKQFIEHQKALAAATPEMLATLRKVARLQGWTDKEMRSFFGGVE